MTLCLAVLTEEGTIMAADSLGTMSVLEENKLVKRCDCGYEGIPSMRCPKCGKEQGLVPPLLKAIPSTQTFHCQKLFKLNTWVGLSLAGAPKFKGTKIQHWLSRFINWLNIKKYAQDKTEKMIEHFKEFLNEEKVLEGFQDNTEILIAGISEAPNNSPSGTIMTLTPKGIIESKFTEYGILVIGVHEILDKMFGGGSIQEYPVREFPLQDAVEFAQFLMHTQIGFDKYTNRIPRVGGDVDIAVIHPVSGFRWVKQKDLQKILEE
jgi:20S proteasome alpha/beta subunit